MRENIASVLGIGIDRVSVKATRGERVGPEGRAEAVLHHGVRGRMLPARDIVERAVAEDRTLYGVTTGFGSMAEVPVPAELASASQANLLAFLTTGAGRPVERQQGAVQQSGVA